MPTFCRCCTSPKFRVWNVFLKECPFHGSHFGHFNAHVVLTESAEYHFPWYACTALKEWSLQHICTWCCRQSPYPLWRTWYHIPCTVLSSRSDRQWNRHAAAVIAGEKSNKLILRPQSCVSPQMTCSASAAVSSVAVCLQHLKLLLELESPSAPPCCQLSQS